MDEPTPNLRAPRFGLLLGTTECHHCQARTPTAAVRVPGYQEVVEEGDESPVGTDAGLLHYVQWLDEHAQVQVLARAPWLRYAPTHMSGTTYLANHCMNCGTLQGDHFVFHPDGPYWPADDAALSRLIFVPLNGSLEAVATVGHSMWMERVEQAARHE